MDIAFRIRDVEVSDSLRNATREKVTILAGRCGIDRADVCFSEQRNPRVAERELCAITLFGGGRILRAEAAATEVSVAADRVMGKLEQRANRLRGRLMGRRFSRAWGGPGWVAAPIVAAGLVGSSTASVDFPDNWSAVGGNSGVEPLGYAGASADMGIGDAPADPMTPEEAAMDMAEQGSDIYFFMNAETGRAAVVYRRCDGDIAVVESVRRARHGVRATVDLRS